MSTSALIDTNIILDAAMPERAHHLHAFMLLDEIAYGNLKAYIAASSLKDVYYILTKYSAESSAREYIRSMLDVFSVLPADAQTCAVAAFSNEPDFEDGLIRACAEQANIDFIISRDDEAFRKSKVRKLSAQEYIELFCEVGETSL